MLLADRDQRCAAASLTLPPTLFTGVLGDRRRLEGLIGASRLARDATAEGVVVRRGDGQRCKVVRPGFVRRDDAGWSGARGHNRLTDTSSRAVTPLG